jgi:hypothetical protein
MANKNPKKENLGDFRDLTAKEQRKIASKGGKASVAARKNRKTMREALEMLMFDVEVDEAAKDKLRGAGISEKDFNNQMLITMGLMKKAREGDVQAYNAICSMMGEKPADKIDVNGDLFNNIRVVEDIADDTGNIPRNEDDIPD